MYEIKTEDAFEESSKHRKMFDFSNYSAKSKHYDNSNKLVVGKTKDEMDGVAIEEFTVLKSKIFRSLVDDSSEHEKVKGWNKNVNARISHSEYKNALLSNKCVRHWINRIQSKKHIIGTNEML